MVKWIEMASQSKSSIETNRWVWTLQNAITIAKDNIKRNLNGERRSTPSPATIELATTNETDTQHEHSNEPEKNDTVLEFLVERNTNVFLVCLHLSLAIINW